MTTRPRGTRGDLFDPACPTRHLLDRIGGKWVAPVDGEYFAGSRVIAISPIEPSIEIAVPIRTNSSATAMLPTPPVVSQVKLLAAEMTALP